MKKTFLAMLMAGCSCAVFAQDDSLSTNGNLSTNTSYNAYGTFMATPPETIKTYVLRDYPTATTIHWQQTSPDMWHGYYVTNNQPTHIFYPISFHVPTAMTSWTVALPVRQTWVPDEVVSKSIEMFGPTLYDVGAIKGSSKQDVYMVRVLENGQLSSHYIDEGGNNVTEVYRVETMDANAAMGTSQNMNVTTDTNMSTDATSADATKVKTKTKTSDGKETKTKMKNGKVKTKEF